MGSINQFLQELGAGTSIKDFQHASKLFVDDNYRLSPKYSFLFHVVFDLNDQLSRLPPNELYHTGMLVKSVALPKFSVDTKTFNAYNRVNVVQTKLKYDPVSITFHDDSADTILDFWYNYLSYYYRDTDYKQENYGQATKYNERQTTDWGYKPARYASTNNSSERILKGIRIYSMHQKRFTLYQLINPTITSFQHGDHEQGRNDTMQHTMTVNYETVLYSTGFVKPGDTINFAISNYDKTPSPLTPQGGGTNSILGPGGLLNLADSAINQLGQNPPNVLGAGLSIFKAFQNFKGTNISQAFGSELKNIGLSVLAGQNPMNQLYIPSASGQNGQGASVGAAAAFKLFSSQPAGPQTPSGQTQKSTVQQTNAVKISQPNSGIVDPGTLTGDNVGGIPDLGPSLQVVRAETLEDGTVQQLLANGTKITVNPDKTSTVTGADKNVTTLDAGGNIVNITYFANGQTQTADGQIISPVTTDGGSQNTPYDPDYGL